MLPENCFLVAEPLECGPKLRFQTTPHRSNVARAIGTSHTITQPWADVLVMVEDVVRVVRSLHVYQPVIHGVDVGLADAGRALRRRRGS